MRPCDRHQGMAQTQAASAARERPLAAWRGHVVGLPCRYWATVPLFSAGGQSCAPEGERRRWPTLGRAAETTETENSS